MKVLKRMRYACGMALVPVVVHAQSSVTLYGQIDNGLSYASNTGGSHTVKLDGGILFGNRWGLKGNEDLGSGNHAIFTLESGYSVNSGKAAQGGLAFGRQAFVGVQAPWGTVTAGRMYDSITDFVAVLSPSQNATGYGTHQGDYDRIGGQRLSNAVKYMSPVYRGLSFGMLYSFSNTAGNFHDGSAYTMGAGYTNGPLTLGIVYAAFFKPTFDPYAGIGVSSFLGQTTATRDTTGAVTDTNTALVVDSSKLTEIGGSYAITKAATLYVVVTHNAIKGFGRTSALNVYEGGLQYIFNPVWKLYAGYQHDTFESHAWNQASAGLWYQFSKTTGIYGGVEYLRASAGVDPVVGYSFTPSTSNQQTVVRLGMFHFF
ncbi:MAG: porin [Janthinobacterium lividum]